MTTLATLPDALAREAAVHRPRRVPALDGVRALAVVAVVTYHVSPTLLPGGFLGVDAFFVLSGFLVTTTLLRGLLTTRVDLKAFWVRRARRILPALLVMLAVTTVVVGAVGRDTDVRLFPQLASTLTFTNNWYQATSGTSYFDATAPPVFQHLWSVAVEEQFYLLWPVVVALWARQSRRLLRLAAVTLGLALVSAAAMATSFTAGTDPSRIYFGTGTHAFGLLLGAALALAIAGHAAGERIPVRRGRRALRCVAPCAALTAAVLVATLHDVSPVAYRGGIFAFSLCVAALVGALVLAPGPAARLLSRPWLVWAGHRSYGIYLWHWPACVVEAALLPDRPVWVRTVVVLPITVVCAALSWRYVERPILQDGSGHVLRVLRGRLRRAPAPVTALAVIGLVTLGLASAAAVLRSPEHTVLESSVTAGQHAIDAARDASATASAPQTSPTPEVAAPAPPSALASEPETSDGDRPPLPPQQPGAQAPRAAASPSAVGRLTSVIGDSVSLATAPAILEALPGVEVDATVGRQMRDAPEILGTMARQGRLRPVVVIALGTNGDFATATLDAVLEAAGPQRKVVFVTAHADRSWTASVNQRLTTYVADHPGTALVDWDSAAASVTDFAADGIHPGPQGARILSRLLAQALGVPDVG